MPRSKNSSGVYRPKYIFFAPFSLVSLSPRTRSRPGAERIRQGEGRLSRPPKTALERSHLTENSSPENRILRPRRKKTPDRIPKKSMVIYIYFVLLSRFFVYLCDSKQRTGCCCFAVAVAVAVAVCSATAGVEQRLPRLSCHFNAISAATTKEVETIHLTRKTPTVLIHGGGYLTR